MDICHLSGEERTPWQAQLSRLERNIRYPFGSDSFSIDHGENYFAFFDRLGQTVCYIGKQKDQLAAIGVGVLRKVCINEKREKFWYLCDLKVAPEFRGQKLPQKLFCKAFLRQYLRCRRGYAISMNPSDGSTNRVVTILKNFPFAPLRPAGNLNVYSLDYEKMMAAESLIIEYRGAVSYLSLDGRKNLVLESTGSPMKLLHVQFGPLAEPGHPKPREGFNHMFCAIEDSEFDHALQKRGLFPLATATLVHHNMKHWDWSFILTSDL